MSRRKRRKAYQDVLDSIARLEYELGLSDTPPRVAGFRSAADAAARWKASAYTAGAKYQAAEEAARFYARRTP